CSGKVRHPGIAHLRKAPAFDLPGTGRAFPQARPQLIRYFKHQNAESKKLEISLPRHHKSAIDFVLEPRP
ncbi:MAG TPA: hypothetical protein VK753_08335, partial [Xanthomonadaceae bacterium]|nr:hypothetical protein [Xanthomonadaceae bacterium]